MTRTTHTVTMTFEVTTNKTPGNLWFHIEDTKDEIAGMLDQDLNDATCLASLMINGTMTSSGTDLGDLNNS